MRCRMLSVKAIYSVNTLGGAEPIPINQIECYKLEEWTTEFLHQILQLIISQSHSKHQK
jgi:hypothetical protein